MILDVVAILFFIPFALIYAEESEEVKPCCYPNKMSGTAYFGAKKLFSFAIDYERGMIVEDWAGRLMTQTMVYDLNNEKRYRIRTGGKCSAYDITSLGNYAKCPPEDTHVVGEEEEDGVTTYGYQLDNVSVTKRVNEQCLPLQITKTRGNRVVTITYEAHEGADDSIFENINLSAC